MSAKRTTQVRLTRESADALRRLAGELGFVQTRGILAGELGSIAQMLEAVARGELNVVGPTLIERLQAIRDRYTREDTGQGFGRAEVAWAMADDLRLLIDELRPGNPAN